MRSWFLLQPPEGVWKLTIVSATGKRRHFTLEAGAHDLAAENFAREHFPMSYYVDDHEAHVSEPAPAAQGGDFVH